MNEHVKAEKGEEEEMCKFSLLKKKKKDEGPHYLSVKREEKEIK